MFLEVTDSRAGVADWSCFVSHRLAVVNQRQEDRSVAKESQNRYSKAAKDWGWREFVTLTSLFDQDSGFLVQDTVVFSAEVLILKESSFLFEYADEGSGSPAGLVGVSGSGGGGGGGGSSSAASDVDRNFWVRYKIGIVNQRAAERSVWKEASICTRTWNNSVLQLMKVPELMDAEAGFLVRDAVIFVCDVLDCCPWFEFSDLEVRGWRGRH